MARSEHCECYSGFTCRHCCARAKPYLFTPRTAAEALADAVWSPSPRRMEDVSHNADAMAHRQLCSDNIGRAIALEQERKTKKRAVSR